MFFVYVLVSEIDKSTYVGFTSDLDARLKAHNSGKTKSLRHKLPMRLVYSEEYVTKELAIKREQQLKKNRFAKEQLFKKIF